MQQTYHMTYTSPIPYVRESEKDEDVESNYNMRLDFGMDIKTSSPVQASVAEVTVSSFEVTADPVVQAADILIDAADEATAPEVVSADVKPTSPIKIVDAATEKVDVTISYSAPACITTGCTGF